MVFVLFRFRKFLYLNPDKFDIKKLYTHAEYFFIKNINILILKKKTTKVVILGVNMTPFHVTEKLRF